MRDGNQLLYFIILALSGKLVCTEDVPCLSRQTDAGYICVCNETYCDTIEPPSPLPRGSYYHYSTSDVTPGFTKTVGTFLKSTIVKEPISDISNDVYVWVNSSLEYQTLMGVGASFTDCSGIIFNTLSAGAQLQFVESFFGEAGLEYTLVRAPVGCSDFSLHAYSYDDVPGDVDLKYFNLTEEDFTLKIPLIKMAMNATKRGVKFIASPWTAPSWMKVNNAPKPGYLRPQYHQAYTNYLLKFFEAYSDLGIDFWGLTQGNEVTIPLFFGQFFQIPNTMMLPAQARDWTKNHLGPLLRGSKFSNVKILALDDERPFMTWWSDRLFADKEVAQYIDGIALHWYFDSNSTVPELEEFNNNYPGKFIMYTESSINTFQSGGSAVSLGDWSRALRYINNIFQNLGHWVVGYIDWNIALNEDGGPTGPQNITLEASVIINATSGEFYKQPIFYALGHFSKFTYPGSKRINVTIKQDTLDDFYEERSYETMLNEMERILQWNFDDPSATPSPFPTKKPEPPSNTVLVLATSNPTGSRTVIAYNPRSEPVHLIVTDPDVGTFNQTVEAHSLNSFLYW